MRPQLLLHSRHLPFATRNSQPADFLHHRKLIKQDLDRFEIPVYRFVDNDVKKVGTRIEGVPVIGFQELVMAQARMLQFFYKYPFAADETPELYLHPLLHLLLQENLREFPRVENINAGVGEREQILAFHGTPQSKYTS